MPDFITAPCKKPNGNCQKEGVVCKETTNALRFGLCDDRPEDKLPARIDKTNEEKWQLTIENPTGKDVTFKAVDFCVDVYRTGEELIKRCEGFLLYENNIRFIELKNSGHRGWLSDARQKFEETILAFRENHPEQNLSFLPPIVSNNLDYRTPRNFMTENQKLVDTVDLELKIQTRLLIS